MSFVNSICSHIRLLTRLQMGKCKKNKTYGLEGLYAPLRQGSSLRSQPCPINRSTATR